MAGPSVAERLENLKKRISKACAASGRAPESVRLLAVSKLQPPERIREALAHGQNDFAENYIQEADEKIGALAGVPHVSWHFIGRIQSNKVKQLAGKFHAIHSVDRAAIAEALDRASFSAGRVQDIFLQINIADEASKGGASAEEFEHLLTSAGKCANLRVMGLMVMPPLSDDPEKARPLFAKARGILQTKRALLDPRHPFNELSMGTSQDFPAAIAEGATWVRIGSEIFGPREENA